MSHIATSWAVSIRGISAGEFRVLMTLADCHNPARGCFPSAEYLRDACEMSNGALYEALKRLEEKGHIRRVRKADRGGIGRAPTHYILGFEVDQIPENGIRPDSGNPEIGEGLIPAGRKQGQDQIPDSGEPDSGNPELHIRKEPVREPVIDKDHSAAQNDPPSFSQFWKTWPLAKIGKKKAEAAFKRLSAQHKVEAVALATEWATKWRAQYPGASDLHPTTYLNGRRWQDEFASQQPTSNTPQNVQTIPSRNWSPGAVIPSEMAGEDMPPPAKKRAAGGRS